MSILSDLNSLQEWITEAIQLIGIGVEDPHDTVLDLRDKVERLHGSADEWCLTEELMSWHLDSEETS